MSPVPGNQPHDIKNRAGLITDGVVGNEKKKEIAIKCLEAEGFPNARKEIESYRVAYWDAKHSRHQATVDLIAEMYKARGDWL